MTTPSSGPISMNDVYLETNLTRNMDNFFDVAAVGGGGGGMYHNLLMGPSNNQSFASNIYVPYNAGSNLPLSNWYNYTQNANILIDWDFNNANTENDVNVNLGLYDPNSTAYNMFTSFSVSANNGNNNASNYDTMQQANNYGGGVYQVVVDVAAIYVGGGRPPGAGVTSNTTSANDVDGVGAGTSRTAYNIPNFDSFSPLSQVIIAGGSVNGTDIYINKRTNVQVAFN